MRIRNPLSVFVAFAVLIVVASRPSSGQEYKMTTPIAPGVATPDKHKTSIGTLNLSYG